MNYCSICGRPLSRPVPEGAEGFHATCARRRIAILEAFREVRARYHQAIDNRPAGDTSVFLYEDPLEHADSLLNDMDPGREIFTAAQLVEACNESLR
jgi:hypothetical protein